MKSCRGIYLRLPFLGLKQLGKIVCVGIKTSKKDGLCWQIQLDLKQGEYKS